jgi:hypothetical protein
VREPVERANLHQPFWTRLVAWQDAWVQAVLTHRP